MFENMDDFATCESFVDTAIESLNAVMSDTTSTNSIDDAINSITAATEGLMCNDCVSKLLEKVKANVASKCKTVEDCDKMLEDLKIETAKFNDCLTKMADTAKAFKAGSIEKAEMVSTISPCLDELKNSCDILKVGEDCIDKSEDLTDEDVACLRAFLIGTHDIITGKRDELSVSDGEGAEKIVDGETKKDSPVSTEEPKKVCESLDDAEAAIEAAVAELMDDEDDDIKDSDDDDEGDDDDDAEESYITDNDLMTAATEAAENGYLPNYYAALESESATESIDENDVPAIEEYLNIMEVDDIANEALSEAVIYGISLTAYYALMFAIGYAEGMLIIKSTCNKHMVPKYVVEMNATCVKTADKISRLYNTNKALALAAKANKNDQKVSNASIAAYTTKVIHDCASIMETVKAEFNSVKEKYGKISSRSDSKEMGPKEIGIYRKDNSIDSVQYFLPVKIYKEVSTDSKNVISRANAVSKAVSDFAAQNEFKGYSAVTSMMNTVTEAMSTILTMRNSVADMIMHFDENGVKHPEMLKNSPDDKSAKQIRNEAVAKAKQSYAIAKERRKVAMKNAKADKRSNKVNTKADAKMEKKIDKINSKVEKVNDKSAAELDKFNSK